MTRRTCRLSIVAVCVLVGCKRPAPPAPPPTTRPAATKPAAVTVVPEPPVPAAPPADVLATLLLDRPDYPTKRPLDTPTDLADAAKIVLDRPACVGLDGTLYLTHPQGQPIALFTDNAAPDHTAVIREHLRFFYRPPGNPGGSIIGDDDALRAVGSRSDHLFKLPVTDFGRAQVFDLGVVMPTRGGVALFYPTVVGYPRVIDLPTAGNAAINATRLAAVPDGVWAWSPWENGKPGSRGAVFVNATGAKAPDATAGWPEKLIEVIPLVDGSVLTVALGEAGPTLKLIAAADKPPTGDLLRTVQPLARKLADRDPAVRQAAQRQLEAQGPAVLPVLEAMREQLPPEAQMRIETMLGQRFAPTLGGLRPLPGRVRTLARFPGGGCVLRLDGGGTIDPDGDTPARSVTPATVLIRPGYPIELIDPEGVTDFLPGRQSIQWIGDELLISDPTVGPRRWVGQSLLKPILPKELADFDTVVAIDTRRRWLLTSAKRPGKTLLIDPTLPDTTPKLPTWTVIGESVGRTDAGWPAVRRGDRVFVLERGGWRVDKPAAMRQPAKPLAIAADKAGRYFSIGGGNVHCTDTAGHDATAAIDGDADDAVPLVLPGRLLVYTPDGKVRRYGCGGSPLAIKPEATFTAGVPRDAVVWIDPAGRLAMTSGTALTVAFPEGRIPRDLADLMLNVGR